CPANELLELLRLWGTGGHDDVRERADGVGERLALRRIDDRDAAVVGRDAEDRRSRSRDRTQSRQLEHTGAVSDGRDLEVTLECICDVDVRDAAVRLAQRRGDTRATSCTHTRRPVDCDAFPYTALPLSADAVQVLRQVVRRAA